MRCASPFCARRAKARYRTADDREDLDVCRRCKSELEQDRREWAVLFREIAWLKERRT